MMAGASSEVISEVALACNPAVKCPWSIKTGEATAVSLEDVMSEELAKDLQVKENAVYISVCDDDDTNVTEMGINPTDCSSDFLLAQYLQMEYDKEHDENLSREQAKVNGNSKVSVSYSNYMRYIEDLGEDESTDEDIDSDKRHWDCFEKSQKDSPAISKCGYTKNAGVITTKHDGEMTARRNACRVMEFPPGIHTGDGGSFDMQLNNSTFNKLKVHSLNESKRQQRLHDKIEKSTTMQTLDEKTMLILRKMIDNDILESINGSVATGKESVVFHASGMSVCEEGDDGRAPIPEECAVKIYKTTLNEFKNRDKYISGDHRFKDRLNKQNPRRLIHIWAEKEMRNLLRMRSANIPCPQVVILRKHVLVMSFLGRSGQPAPRLKEAKLSDAEWIIAYETMLELTRRLFMECRLVHADLSEFNILWHDDQCWIIDVSQAVEHVHPSAYEFLYRDCQNLSSFFERKKVPNVKSAREIFEHVCDIKLQREGKELQVELQNLQRGNEKRGNGVGSNFEFDDAWIQSKTKL